MILLNKAIVNDIILNKTNAKFKLFMQHNALKIAIGGGISKQQALIDCIRDNIEKHAKNIAPMILLKPEVVPCKFFNDSNLIGALYNYMIKYDLLKK